MSDEDYDDDEDYVDYEDEDGDEDVFEENNTCGSCQHWAPGSGKCFCSGKNNPHYYNGDRMDADDSCIFWEKHF